MAYQPIKLPRVKFKQFDFFCFHYVINKREHVGLPMLFSKPSPKKITLGLIAFKKTCIYIVRKPKPILKGERTQCYFGF
jgi:hypothetical protein